MGEIITRYERLGLKLVGLKMVVPSAEQVEGHYTLDPNWRRVTGDDPAGGCSAQAEFQRLARARQP